MVPTNKEQLHKMVSAKTIEAYEELAPQVVQLIDMTKKMINLAKPRNGMRYRFT